MDTQANYCMLCGGELILEADHRSCPHGCPPDWPMIPASTDSEARSDFKPDQLPIERLPVDV